MKKILLAVLLILSLSVNAAVVAETINDGGGRIALTDVKCNSIQGAFIAYSYIANGKSLMGCWVVETNRVFVKWDDGDLRSYPLDAFRQQAGKSRNYM